MEELTRYIIKVYYTKGQKEKFQIRVHQSIELAQEELKNLLWDIQDGTVERFEFKVKHLLQ